MLRTSQVLMVELKSSRRIYAMKVIKKELVTDDEDIDWVQTEKHVFETASNHPFLVGLHSCFQVLYFPALLIAVLTSNLVVTCPRGVEDAFTSI